MKTLLVFFVVIFFGGAYAQDTLYLPVYGLGHEKYVLNENGTFIFSSHLCGDSFYSFGNYRQSRSGYTFEYDTTRCPSPSVYEKDHAVNSDSITLRFYNMVDSLPHEYPVNFRIGTKRYSSDSNLISVPKPSEKANELIIEKYGNNQSFNFDATCSELHVYLEPFGFAIRCGMNDIRKLKKTARGYLHKTNVFDEIKGKPWKKGTKRVVRQYYQLRQ